MSEPHDLAALWAEAGSSAESIGYTFLGVKWLQASEDPYEPEGWYAEVEGPPDRPACNCCGRPFGYPERWGYTRDDPAEAVHLIILELRKRGAK
jgi:hypothetical protein